MTVLKIKILGFLVFMFLFFNTKLLFSGFRVVGFNGISTLSSKDIFEKSKEAKVQVFLTYFYSLQRDFKNDFKATSEIAEKMADDNLWIEIGMKQTDCLFSDTDLCFQDFNDQANLVNSESNFTVTYNLLKYFDKINHFLFNKNNDQFYRFELWLQKLLKITLDTTIVLTSKVFWRGVNLPHYNLDIFNFNSVYQQYCMRDGIWALKCFNNEETFAELTVDQALELIQNFLNVNKILLETIMKSRNLNNSLLLKFKCALAKTLQKFFPDSKSNLDNLYRWFKKNRGKSNFVWLYNALLYHASCKNPRIFLSNSW